MGELGARLAEARDSSLLLELPFLAFLGGCLYVRSFFYQAVWVLFGLAVLSTLVRVRPRRPGPLNAVVLTFALSQVLSLWWSQNPGVSRAMLLASIGPWLAVYFATGEAIRDWNRFLDVVAILAVGTLLLAGLAVYQHFFGLTATGTVENRNLLGMTLNLSLPLFASLAGQKDLPRALRILLALVFGLSSLAVVYALGRGAWLAYLVAIGFVAWTLRSRALVTALGATLVSAPFLFPKVGVRVAKFVGPNPTSGRWVIWDAAARAIKDHPWLGTGFGTFEELFHRYHQQDVFSRIIHAHNLPLNLWAETGLPGLLAGALLAWVVLRTGWRLIRETRGGRWHGAAVGLFASFLGFLVHNQVSDGLLRPATFGLFAVNLALLQVVALNTSAVLDVSPDSPTPSPR